MTVDRKWVLAWAKFEAMYSNLPNVVNPDRVADFHAILDLLQESSGEDLSSFRVPDSEIRPRAYLSRIVCCDRDFMLTQMDGVRQFFENIQPSPKKAQIGF